MEGSSMRYCPKVTWYQASPIGDDLDTPELNQIWSLGVMIQTVPSSLMLIHFAFFSKKLKVQNQPNKFPLTYK